MFYSFAYADELCSLAQKLITDEKWPEARFLLDHGLERFPGTPRLHLLSGKTWAQQGQPAKAEQALRRAIELNGTLEDAYIELAKLVTPTEGKALLLAAYNLTGKSIPALKALVKWSLANNDLPLAGECIGLWSRSGEVGSANELAGDAARLMFQSGNRAEAETLLRQMLDQQLIDRESLALLLQIVREKGSVGEQQLTLSKAIERLGPTKLLRDELNRLSAKKPQHDPQLIVFVTNQPAGRLLKLARGVRENGYRTAIIYLVEPSDESWRRYFDEVRRCNYVDDALLAAADFDPLVFHVLSAMADDLSVAFIREKPGRVIFDGYDFCEGMLWADYTPKISEMQRFCMENADALTCRDLRCRFLFREMNYRAPEQIIFFPDYCWDEQVLPEKPRGEIHVAAAGYIGTSKSGEVDWGHFDMAQYFAAAGVHFHIYPHPMQAQSPNFSEVFEDLIRFEKQTQFFHLHRPVDMDAVSIELAKYHFGVNVLWPLCFDREMTSYSAAYHRLCSSARNIEYLDAGLVTIVNRRLKFQYWLFDRKGIAIDGSIDFFKNPRPALEAKLAEPDLAARIAKFRSSHSVRHNAARLITFYEKVGAR